MGERASEGLNVGLRHAHVNAVHGAGERLVGGLDASVDDLDDLLVALLGRLVGTRHLQGGGVLQGGVHRLRGRRVGIALDDHRLVVTLDEGGLDALGGLDGVEGRGRGLDGEAVERAGVVSHVRHVRAGHDRLDRGFDAVLDFLVFGRGTQAEDSAVPRDSDATFSQLDDDRRRRVVGRETIRGGGRVLFPTLLGGFRLRAGV